MPLRFISAPLFWVILISSLSLTGFKAVGQARIQRSGTFWPELQAEYILKSTSFFYVRNQYRHNFDDDFNNLRESGGLNQLERIQLRVGYEQVINHFWSGGIATGYALERTQNIIFNKIYLRHSGNLGKYRLAKRASFEHIYRSTQSNYPRARFRVDLDRELKIAGQNFRPRISYDLFFNFSYSPSDIATSQERRVDRTRLRLDISYLLNAHFTLTPYFIHNSDYFLVEPTYNEFNEVVRPGGKQNHLTPIFGLEARYSIFRGGVPIPRINQILE